MVYDDEHMALKRTTEKETSYVADSTNKTNEPVSTTALGQGSGRAAGKPLPPFLSLSFRSANFAGRLQ